MKLENVIFFFFLGRMKEAVTKKKQGYVIDETSPSTCDNYVSGNPDYQGLNLPFLMSYFDEADSENRDKKKSISREFNFAN